MLIAYWDGLRLHGWNADDGLRLLDVPAVSEAGEGAWSIPPWKEDAVGLEAPAMLALPMERLLVRPFALPLASPRLLDHAILGQEMASQSGIEPEDWWLCWRAVEGDGGIVGMAFGLPVQAKEHLSLEAIWARCPVVTVDGWLRLSSWLSADAGPACAVMDADAEGVFLGVWREGAWRGLRRLNAVAGRSQEEMVEDAMRSLMAMGYEPESMPALGRLDAAWQETMAKWLPAEGWRGEVVETLSDRAHATCLAAAGADLNGAPNFRHGSWAVAGDWRERLRPWRPSLTLAATLLLLLFGGDIYHLHRLNAEQRAIQQGIEEEFHRGLPGETVMLDPLAQLRKAAGQSGGGEAWLFLRQLQVLGQLRQKTGSLQVDRIEFDGHDMRLGGRAADLDAVNRLRDQLSAMLREPVRLDDTELANQEVRFRLHWRALRS